MTKSEWAWLESPVHLNHLGKFEVTPEIKETLQISFDGSIMAVLRSKVESLYKELEVDQCKTGYKSYPKKMEISDEEAFYKFLAYNLEA